MIYVTCVVAALTFVVFSANRLARRGREKTAVGAFGASSRFTSSAAASSADSLGMQMSSGPVSSPFSAMADR